MGKSENISLLNISNVSGLESASTGSEHPIQLWMFLYQSKVFQKYEVHKSRSGVVGQNDPGYQKNLITSNNRLRKINIQEIYEREKKAVFVRLLVFDLYSIMCLF